MESMYLYTFSILFCSVFVILMQAGFAMVDTGFTRAKNAGHTMMMALMVPVLAVLGYWICGFSIQTGGGLFLSGAAADPRLIPLFLSQAAFLIIATTIPIGAMSERWSFRSFILYSLFVAAFVYPLFSRWIWDGGWLAQLGTHFGLGHGVVDFAGSSVVHMTGGVAGLAGAVLLGPRSGKFRTNGTPTAIPGHHVPMATVGALVLFFGWFGLHLAQAFVTGGLQPGTIVLNTMLSAAASTASATFCMWFLYGKPDLSLAINGLLGGLVAISGACAFVPSWAAFVIGLVAGLVCCGSVFFLERKLKVDDPVGSISVHGTCGLWGMIGLGLFADGGSGNGLNGVAGGVKGLLYGDASQLLAQIIGVAVNGVFVFGVMFVFFKVLSRMVPIRVSEEVEFEGLDQSEVAVTAYPDFITTKRR